MDQPNRTIVNLVAVGLIVSTFGSATLPAIAQQPAATDWARLVSTTTAQPGGSYSKNTRTEQAALSEFPDSPGAVRFASQQQSNQQNTPPVQSPAQSPAPISPDGTQTAAPASAAQGAQPQSQSPAAAQEPVGTAAAETSSAGGVAASQPAGVAIAPAKQHRVRTIVLRTGALIGAGVAVGTVVGLSRSTSSKPPGAH